MEMLAVDSKDLQEFTCLKNNTTNMKSSSKRIISVHSIDCKNAQLKSWI